MEPKGGCLYLCSTPIGNMEDVTLRVVRILSAVTCIAAEDTRHTRKLLRHHGIETPLISLHDHNEAAQSGKLVERMRAGEAIALVSDAGTPAISDPGYLLVTQAIDAEISVVPVPGPSAILAALVASGLPPYPFYFGGFLPRKESHRRRLLKSLTTLDATLVFYEVPHRLQKSLADSSEIFPQRRGVVAREMTKVHEEFVRGTLVRLAEHFVSESPRGECVLMIEGRQTTEEVARTITEDEIHEALAAAMEAGKTKKEAIKDVTSLLGVDRKIVYQAAITLSLRDG